MLDAFLLLSMASSADEMVGGLRVSSVPCAACMVAFWSRYRLLARSLLSSLLSSCVSLGLGGAGNVGPLFFL